MPNSTEKTTIMLGINPADFYAESKSRNAINIESMRAELSDMPTTGNKGYCWNPGPEIDALILEYYHKVNKRDLAEKFGVAYNTLKDRVRKLEGVK